MATLELKRALARPDAETLVCQVEAYVEHFAKGEGEWPEEHADAFAEILHAGPDAEKALAYVIIAASRTDDADFLLFLGCGPLENLLFYASPELMRRIIAEARRSARFRWLLSCPYKVAIDQAVWEQIKPFRQTGEHEEPSVDTLPPRNVA